MNWPTSRISLSVALLVCMSMLAAGAASGQATPQTSVTADTTPGVIQGTVKAGNIPLPGATVIAVNSAGDKFSSATNESGLFQMHLPPGTYNIRASLAGFAPVTQTLHITTAENPPAEFPLVLASRATQAEAASRSASQRGLQSLTLTGSDADNASPAAGAAAETTDTTTAGAGIPDPGAATDSVAINGQVGSTNALGSMTEDDIRQRIQDAIAQGHANGMQGGDIANSIGSMLGSMMGGGPGGGGPPGGGGGQHTHSFRGFNPTQPHGSIFYNGGNSALNTRGFYTNGPPPVTPSYNSNTYGVTLAGSPYIPGLFKPSTKQFVFLNFTGLKSSRLSVFNATVPTGSANPATNATLQRGGDFAGGSTIYMRNGSPFPGNIIPTCTGGSTTDCITPQAQALLAYYPLPNITPTATSSSNYQRVVSPSSDSNTVALRYVRNFGQAGGMSPGGFGGFSKHDLKNTNALRQNVNGTFNYQHSANDIYTAFPQLGGNSATNSLAFGAGYTIGYGRLNNNLSLNWNRSHAITHNYFTGLHNPATDAGLSLGDPTLHTQNNPLNYGVPGVSFAQFTGFTDTTPADKINQVISFSENSSWNHHKHNVHFGFDIRRIHLDTLAGTNVLGSYTFTGYGSCQQLTTGTCTPNTGSDFADFLLGLPQQTSIQASNFKYYLRANAWDFFVQDDWRIRPNLTLNFGLRYEYFSPYGEKYDRLANLALTFNPLLTSVTCVEPNPTSTACAKSSHTLVNPDRNNFSPRFGFAWKPSFKFVKDTVVRGGYGVNYNTSQYATFALGLASEPSFADTQTNIANNNGCPQYLSWSAPSTTFNCPAPAGVSNVIRNNFAVDPNYRLGYVQIWNFGIQRTLPLQTVLNIDYTGSKGTRLDMVREPNRPPLNGVDQFKYEDSVGGSHLNSLAINLRKRLQRGVSLGATYTYSHSIDNASSINGTSTVIAQNDQNLHAEEGNSGFDVRQKVSGNWVFELPFGPNTLFFNGGGLFSRIVQGWSLSGDYTFATGTPLTPHYSNLTSEVARGSNGSYRPDRIPGVSVTAGGGNYLHWINNYAYFNAQGVESNTGQCTQPVAAGSNCPFATPLVTAANPFGYGNASRNSIRGPGTVSINAALSKTIQLGTTRSFEMRASANNVFNTVQYNGVDTNLNSHTFGQITSVSSSRQITVLARYRF